MNDDCSGCTNCNDCTNSNDCISCNDCTNSNDCTNCFDCSWCIRCSNCFDCHDCTHCISCVDCSGLRAATGEVGIHLAELMTDAQWRAVAAIKTVSVDWAETRGYIKAETGFTPSIHYVSGYLIEKGYMRE